MSRIQRGFLLIALLSLAACNHKPVAECSAKGSQEPVVALVKEQLEKLISNQVKNEDGQSIVSLSKIRAMIAQTKIVIEDVRTSKEDPNSTKRFCTGTLAITIPDQAVSDAEATREKASFNTIDQLADQSGINREANRFSTDLEFNVQPTDDGEKVFAQTESGNNMFGFASQVLSSALLKTAVMDAARQQEQAKQAEQAAQDAAVAEQKAAALNEAKTQNQLAVQAINAAWQAIPSDTRTNLLPLQRAWLRKMIADCKVEAAAASLDPSERQVAELRCNTQADQERMNWINQYRSEEIYEE